MKKAKTKKKTTRRRRMPTLAEARARLEGFQTSWDLLTPEEREAFKAAARLVPEVCGQSPYLIPPQQRGA